MDQITSVCEKCNVEFTYVPKHKHIKRFCSYKCSNSKTQTSKINKKRSETLIKKTCGYFDKPYVDPDKCLQDNLEIISKKIIEFKSMAKTIDYVKKELGYYGSYLRFKGFCIQNSIWNPNPGKRTISVISTSEIFVENFFYRAVVRRRILEEKLITYECSMCENNGNWNNRELTLELDHINGVKNDQRLENLRFLCPNCHSQTDTFKNKNVKSKKRTIITDEDLDQIISKDKNIHEVLKKHNYTASAGNYKLMYSKLIKKFTQDNL